MQIGICGTFDLENYGDLLFPIVAEHELQRRLGAVELRRFSYAAKAPPDWPYLVSPLSELPTAIGSLDGLMIGGGDLIRFDKEVAPGYLPAAPDIHHPTGYWLVPALLALNVGCPLVWNAPGVYKDLPGWAEPILRFAIASSDYVAVRDQLSRAALEHVSDTSKISVVPDTGLGVAGLIAEGSRCSAPHAAGDVTPPYLVVQAGEEMQAFCRLVRDHPGEFRGYRIVALPIGPALGDSYDLLDRDLGFIHLPGWPEPPVIAGLISAAAAVIGPSLHLALTALAAGVPVFRPGTWVRGKFAVLSQFESVHHFDPDREITPEWFFQRLGRREPELAVRQAVSDLDSHWNKIASIFAAGRKAATPGGGSLLQSLPRLFEAESLRQEQAKDELKRQWDLERSAARQKVEQLGTALALRNQEIESLTTTSSTERDAARGRERRMAELERQLSASRAEAAAHEVEITALYKSTSWRLTAPVRWVGRRLLPRARRPKTRVLRLGRFEQQTVATHPYAWAFVNDVYSRRDARALAASFPEDKFKTVIGYDGEKHYEYEARALIHLGEAATLFDGLSPAWQRLASDLLSPAYRQAMSRLTGQDLTTAPIEAYVCHYGPGAWLGPHLDLKDKIVTHVFYFNESWDVANGGCLRILRSSDIADVVAEISPVVGNSSVLVRSDKSWHAVSPVARGCRDSRRSMNVIFYHPGAISTMWPPGDDTPLHRYRRQKEG